MSPFGESLPPTTVNPKGFLPAPFSYTMVNVPPLPEVEFDSKLQDDLGLRGNVQNEGDSSLSLSFIRREEEDVVVPLEEKLFSGEELAGESRFKEAVPLSLSIRLITNLRRAELISLRLEVLVVDELRG